MTNDGWGKLPTDDDWARPKSDPNAIQTDGGWGAPLGSDSWQTSPPLPPSDAVSEPKADDGWGEFASSNWSFAAGVHPAQTLTELNELDKNGLIDWGDDFKNVSPDDYGDHAVLREDHEAREAAATLSRQTDVEQRASVLNALSGKRDEWVMETDGELNRREEVIPTVSRNEATGFYIAYHTGKWLHAVLSGPYPDKGAAIVMADAAYARMTEDSVFKLAFENKFERNGIYIAEIPLSARRHGAYGVLA